MDLLDIKGVGEKTVEKLNSLDIFTPNDLLMFLPTKYTNMTPTPISEIRSGCFYVVKAKYTKKVRQFRNKKLNIFSIQVTDEVGDNIIIDWFNQDYISKIMVLEDEYIFYGKVTEKKGKLILVNPEVELSKNAKRLTGIRVEYKTKGIVTSNKISTLVSELKDNIKLSSFITNDIANKHNLLPLDKAVYSLHFPEHFEDLQKNLNRIKLEKIVNLMLAYNDVHERSKTKRVVKYNTDISVLNDAVDLLDYNLTSSQVNAIKTLVSALKSDYNTSYMLLGDVGSGKTIVSLMMCYYAIKSGGKAVMLVPSETLLTQHYQSAEILVRLGVRVAKLSASTKTKERQEILDRLNRGEIDLILGTQSLLNEQVNLSNFTYAVIDEQQKFGVNEKGVLLKKLRSIDSLVMSATPIPRAISLMFNNTLNVVEISKAKSRETNIKTMLVNNLKLKDMLDYIYQQAKQGVKSFVVCPNIIGSENRLGVYNIYDYFNKKYNISPLVLNSKVDDQDKTDIMKEFSTGKNNILISTTIVEVGIDIQDAKNMVIINSECFGLSSLHQLRGRVGRDGSEANCFLHYSVNNDKVVERLNILKNNDDGFMISKLDYELRGGGEIFGTKQSGKADLIDIDLMDSELIVLGQQIFNDIISSGADLTDADCLTPLFDKINEIVLA